MILPFASTIRTSTVLPFSVLMKGRARKPILTTLISRHRMGSPLAPGVYAIMSCAWILAGVVGSMEQVFSLVSRTV
jgi:hypothetical protein